MTDQKRDRRREATRERILAAATELAREGGWPSVTMRKIADRVDYTHPALYAYFPTKEALLLALLREGLKRFRADLEAAADAAASPEAAVLALTAALWDFPWKHPELYQVMHGLGGVAFVTGEARAEERATVEPAAAVVGEILARHGRDVAEAEGLSVLQWATVHGLVTLTMSGRFTREEGAALAALAGRNALEAMTSPPPAAGPDGAVSA
jgi:AcrR family transcriptional regulator